METYLRAENVGGYSLFNSCRRQLTSTMTNDSKLCCRVGRDYAVAALTDLCHPSAPCGASTATPICAGQRVLQLLALWRAQGMGGGDDASVF